METKLLLSLVPKETTDCFAERLLSETEFLSEGGIRALSKYHEKHPYSVDH